MPGAPGKDGYDGAPGEKGAPGAPGKNKIESDSQSHLGLRLYSFKLCDNGFQRESVTIS